MLVNPKPPNPKLLVENIPTALKELDRWGCWYFKEITKADGEVKWDKPPVLSTREPDKWGAFNTACEIAKAKPLQYAGIGLCVTGLDNGLVAWDLDKVLREDGTIHPRAESIVKRLGSYTEWSPSRTGLRIFTTGRYDADWVNRDAFGHKRGLEVYSGWGGRYLTMTGQHFDGAPMEIRPVAEDVLKAIADEFRVTKGSTLDGAPPEMPELLDDVAVPVNLPVKAREFLESGENGGDRSGTLLWVSRCLTEAGLDPQEVLSLLVANCHAMEVAMDHRRQDEERGMVYLWKHMVLKAAAKHKTKEAEMLEVLEDGSLDEPEALSDMPASFTGPMAEMVAAGLEASPTPQPKLMTLAVLIGMAASIPGNYALPSGNRCNLYGLMVAGTGEGKDAPRRAGGSIALAAGVSLWGRPASGQGLEDVLGEDYCSGLAEVDEIGHLISAVNAKADPHLAMLAQSLLKMFSVSNGIFTTRLKAKGKNVEPSRSIKNVCVNLLGASTPELLGRALTVENVADGLLGRMLFADADPSVRPRLINSAVAVPQTIVDLGRKITTSASMADLTHGSENIAIRYGEGVFQRMEQLLRSLYDERQASSQHLEKGLKMRTWEKIDRVAGVLAVWSAPEDPVISLEHVAWAEKFVRYSDAALLRFCAEYLANGETQANYKSIRKLCEEILEDKYAPKTPAQKALIRQRLAPWSMALNLSKLDAKKFREAIEHSVDLEEIEHGSAKTKSGRAIKWLRLL